MITNPIEQWDSEHAARLRAFLESPTGGLTVEILRSLRPPRAATNDTNDIVRRCGQQEGAEHTLETIFLMTRAEFLQPSGDESSNYPPLDDDTKWQTPKK